MTLAPEVTQVGMPLEQFLEEYDEQPFELIDGEKVFLMPPNFTHSELSNSLATFLREKIKGLSLATIYIEMTFVLPDTLRSKWVKGSRIPDVMVYVGDRIKQYKQMPTFDRNAPLELVPNWVIEVVSPNDKATALKKKINAYLEDGVRLIWQLDYELEEVTVYRPSGDSPVIYRMGQTIDASEIIEGLSLTVDELFEVN